MNRPDTEKNLTEDEEHESFDSNPSNELYVKVWGGFMVCC